MGRRREQRSLLPVHRSRQMPCLIEVLRPVAASSYHWHDSCERFESEGLSWRARPIFADSKAPLHQRRLRPTAPPPGSSPGSCLVCERPSSASLLMLRPHGVCEASCKVHFAHVHRSYDLSRSLGPQLHYHHHPPAAYAHEREAKRQSSLPFSDDEGRVEHLT